MTYSIIARDTESGQMGVAVQSHFFGVGSLVPWARAGVGVIATQSVVNPAYGESGLQLLEEGVSPQLVLDQMRARDAGANVRQVAIMNAAGGSAGHTGQNCIGYAGESASANSRAQANMVADTSVWTAMTETFEATGGTLAERMLAALQAAEANGGDLRGRQAAAMKTVRMQPVGDLARDLLLDIRVDDHEDPLGELTRLYWASQTFGGLLGLLETRGLLTGEFTAEDSVVVAALDELAIAQDAAGPRNHEPTVWRGLLLARAGRLDEARQHFELARTTNPRARELVRQLAISGMWTRSLSELEEVLPH